MRRTKTAEPNAIGRVAEVTDMELIQIGTPEVKTWTSVREMFERLAQKEADMVRSAREHMTQTRASSSCSTGVPRVKLDLSSK